jgi:ferredoxin--NADP+ reductase
VVVVENFRLASTAISRNEEVAPGIRLLTFPRRGDFIPGQTLALTTDQTIPARYYSIASGRDETSIEILYDVVPGGMLTPRLARLRPGDTVFVSEAFGSFADDEGSSVWIAAGTGVAPFVSMARSGMLAGKALVHGSRTLGGLYLRSYFSSMLRERYVPCCSSETAGGVFFGRTTAWLAGTTLSATNRYLLCGSSRMVVDVRDILIAQGVYFDRIVAEIYF